MGSVISHMSEPIFERPAVDPMGLAFDEAYAAQKRGEVPIGAVVIYEGQVIGRAGNQTIADHDPTAHAEIIALRQAAQHLGSERLINCDLYVTLEPCPMCAGAASWARLRRLYYAASDLKGGAVESGPRLFNQPTCHHAPEVYSGLRESESAALLRDFFKQRRGAR